MLITRNESTPATQKPASTFEVLLPAVHISAGSFFFLFFFFTFSQFTAGFGKVIWVQQDGIFLLTLLYMYLFVLHERYLSLVHVSDPPQCDRHPKMTDDLAATLMLIILLQFIVNSCWFWKMSLPSFFGLMYCLGTQPITAFHSGSHYITVW